MVCSHLWHQWFGGGGWPELVLDVLIWRQGLNSKKQNAPKKCLLSFHVNIQYVHLVPNQIR